MVVHTKAQQPQVAHKLPVARQADTTPHTPVAPVPQVPQDKEAQVTAMTAAAVAAAGSVAAEAPITAVVPVALRTLVTPSSAMAPHKPDNAPETEKSKFPGEKNLHIPCW
jgi:hypothetical protein